VRARSLRLGASFALAAVTVAACTMDFDRFEPTTVDGLGTDAAPDSGRDGGGLPFPVPRDGGDGGDDAEPPCNQDTCLSTANACATDCRRTAQSCLERCGNPPCRNQCNDAAKRCTTACEQACSACVDGGCTAEACADAVL
jgi:hypothetical protein